MSSREIVVRLQRMAHAENLDFPQYATQEAAGMDLRAALPAGKISLYPAQRHLIPTGLVMEIPKGYEAQIRPRSGLALKHGVTILNAPGTIDSDYRGEICVVLINHGTDIFTIEHGDRIAQIIFAPVTQGILQEVDILSESHRGTAGFGSTGISQ